MITTTTKVLDTYPHLISSFSLLKLITAMRKRTARRGGAPIGPSRTPKSTPPKSAEKKKNKEKEVHIHIHHENAPTPSR